LSYLQFLVVGVLAWLLFNETVDTYTLIGAAIVISASLYIARREGQVARQQFKDALAAKAKPPL
jgi:drug/metabolite transporter (DMT)-like permease